MNLRSIAFVLISLNLALNGCGGGASGAGENANNTQTQNQDAATTLVVDYVAIAKASPSYQFDPTYQSLLQQYHATQSSGISSTSALYLIQMKERRIQLFLDNVISYAQTVNSTQPINKNTVYAKLAEQQATDSVLPSNVVSVITASAGTSAQNLISSTQVTYANDVDLLYRAAYAQLVAM